MACDRRVARGRRSAADPSFILHPFQINWRRFRVFGVHIMCYSSRKEELQTNMEGEYVHCVINNIWYFSSIAYVMHATVWKARNLKIKVTLTSSIRRDWWSPRSRSSSSTRRRSTLVWACYSHCMMPGLDMPANGSASPSINNTGV